MSTITPAVAKAISSDWGQQLENMGLYKPLHLLKAAGPFLVGVCLEPTRRKDAYTPIAHLHNLGISFPTVSLSLPTTGPLVTVREHEAGRWRQVAEELRASVPVLRVAPIRVSEIDSLHRAAATSGRFPVFPPYVPIFESLFVLSVFLGEGAFAGGLRDYVSSALRAAGAVHGRRSMQEWEAWTAKLLDRPSLIDETIDAESEKHKVKDVPRVEFVRDANLRPFW